MTPEKKKALKMAHEMCEDCGWYNDCPAEYRCPPLQIIIELITEAPEDKDD